MRLVLGIMVAIWYLLPGLAFVVFLLVITITMVAVTVMAARSDGGAQRVDTPVEQTAP